MFLLKAILSHSSAFRSTIFTVLPVLCAVLRSTTLRSFLWFYCLDHSVLISSFAIIGLHFNLFSFTEVSFTHSFLGSKSDVDSYLLFFILVVYMCSSYYFILEFEVTYPKIYVLYLFVGKLTIY